MKVALCAERFEVFDGILLMMKDGSGFREHAHTADWELEVWAPHLPGLLNQAALGMQTLCGMRLEDRPRQVRTMHLDGLDPESLLVRFLSELLWLAEQEGLGFDSFEMVLGEQGDPVDRQQPLHLEVRMEGAPIAGLDKEIKAVTYHNLEVRQTGNGLEANIVFDV